MASPTAWIEGAPLTSRTHASSRRACPGRSRAHVIATSLTGLAVAAVGILAAGPASAASEATVYTAPNGGGSRCSERSPCGISTAKSAARNLATKGADVSVVVEDGTYRLTGPLRFSTAVRTAVLVASSTAW